MSLRSRDLGVVVGFFWLTGCAGDQFTDGGGPAGTGGAGAQGGAAGAGGAGQGATGGEGQGGMGGSGGAPPAGCDPTTLGAGESLQANCGVFVDATSGSDDGMGTPDAPFATIDRALEESSGGRIYLCAADDPYAGTPVSESVAILGGLDCVTWTYNAERAVIGSTEGSIPLHVAGQAEVRVEDVDVVALDAVAAGASSIAVLIDGADAHLTLTRVLVSAGKGALGAVGTSPPAVAAAPGGSNGGQAGGFTSIPPGGTNICGAVSRIGGAGAPGGLPAGAVLIGVDGSDGDGGAGAPGGSGQPAAPHSWSCATMGKGGDGANGSSGNPGYGAGQATVSIGNLTSSGFELASGGNGSPGQPGHSGGGGGSSRAAGIVGADGGGGGSAGCGGQPGGGGKAGGSSIAVAMVSGVVILEEVVLRTSAGAAGGAGGGGQPGQAGGPGGSGGPGFGEVSTACPGGKGGDGGRGGNGGGGHGGLSVGILQNEGAIVRGTVTWDDANAMPGEGGDGGSAAGATPGQAGNPGFSADSFVLP